MNWKGKLWQNNENEGIWEKQLECGLCGFCHYTYQDIGLRWELMKEKKNSRPGKARSITVSLYYCLFGYAFSSAILS